MCLYVKKPQPPSPTEVMEFYKVVHRHGKRSLYMDMLYIPGTTVVAEAYPDVDFEDAQDARNVGGNEGVYESGVLHFYTSIPIANERADLFIKECIDDGETDLLELDIIGVKCYPEHFVAWGVDGDVCYSQCEVPE